MLSPAQATNLRKASFPAAIPRSLKYSLRLILSPGRLFGPFSIVFGPFLGRFQLFSTVFGPFCMVFTPFFSIFSRRGAVARPWRSHGATTAPSRRRQRRRGRFSGDSIPEPAVTRFPDLFLPQAVLLELLSFFRMISPGLFLDCNARTSASA